MGFPHGTTPPLQVPQISSYPVITVGGSGTPTVGVSNQLSVSNGSWSNAPTSYTIQWQNEGSSISSGGTSTPYTPASIDLGCLISCTVIAHNAAGDSLPARSNLVGPVISTTVRYVSFNDGLDTNDGTTSAPGAPHGPWKTIAKVNSASSGFSGPMSVLFKRNDVWNRNAGAATFNSLTPTSSGTSGNPIVYDAYGTGANPIIDGSYDASHTTDWTNVSGNIWQSAATFPPVINIAVTFSGSTGTPLLVHGSSQTPFSNGSVIFSGASLPTGVVAGTVYYILSPSGSTYEISATPGPGSAKLVIGGSLGSGTMNAGINGFPYFNANDIGNILWNFSALGGTAPAAVNSASFGKMTGGGVGGVWFLPGQGTSNLGTTQGNWNFNTDNFRVQVYSVGNPATAMPGLRLVLDGGGIVVNSFNNLTFQNFTFQYIAASNSVKLLDSNNIIVRDVVFQWIGGGNIGGGSTAGTRAGDGYNIDGTYNNILNNTILIERNFIYQVYDVCVSPQGATAGAHDNLTIRNNIFYKFGTALGIGPAVGSGSSTQNGLYIYNNTANGVASWSANQRPNGGPIVKALDFLYDTFITTSNEDIRNNAFAALGNGAQNYGAQLRNPPTFSLSTMTPVNWDYNLWRLTAATPTQILQSPSTFLAITSWSGTYGFETHGLIDVDPGFTSTADFTPAGGSALKLAGANLFSQGVVWDFFRNPRPASGAFTIGAIQ